MKVKDLVKFSLLRRHCGDRGPEHWFATAGLPHDLGLPVHPFALTGVVVYPSVDLLLGEAGHGLGHTLFRRQSQVEGIKPLQI